MLSKERVIKNDSILADRIVLVTNQIEVVKRCRPPRQQHRRKEVTVLHIESRMNVQYISRNKHENKTAPTATK